MFFRNGIPWLSCESLSEIRPARPTVWPSWIATREVTARSVKVGELIPAVVTVGETPLISWSTSSVTSPPLPTCGVTRKITPVSR